MSKLSRPPLSAGFVRSVFDYDIDSGILRWRYRPDRSKRWNTRYAGTVAGSKVKGYLQVQLQIQAPKKIDYYVHQIAWCWVHGEWPTSQTDHKDRNRGNDRILNLRAADDSENGCNKSLQSNNTSGFAGISFAKWRNQWEARINKDGRRVWRRFFDAKAEAVAARYAALLDHHGEFAAYPNAQPPAYSTDGRT